MALFGSGERRIRPKAGLHVEWAIPDKGTLRKRRGAVGSFGYAVPIVPTGTCIQAYASEDLPGLAKRPAEC